MRSNLLYVLFVIVVSLAGLEFLLRLIGYRPFDHYIAYSLDCYDQFTDYNTQLGYQNKPGDYNCEIRNNIQPGDTRTFHVTHSADGSRYSGTDVISSSDSAVSLHFYGCSVTWGQGVDDTSTLPFQVQELNPQLAVSNFGVGAYSTLQAYLLFRENLEKGWVPDICVLNYGSFQDSRNVLTWSWRAAWQHMIYSIDSRRDFESNYPDFSLPFGKLWGDDSLLVSYMKAGQIMRHLPLREASALMNALNETLEILRDRNKKPEAVTRQIILDMKELCHENGISFILCSIYQDEASQKMLADMASYGIRTMDISVDHRAEGFNLLPYDNHPNHRAYHLMAETFKDEYSKMSRGEN